MKLKAIVTAFFVIAAIAVGAAAGAGASTASFSDKVTSKANTLAAGTLYMQVGSACGVGARTYGGFPDNKGVDNGVGCNTATNSTAPTTSMRPTGTAVAASPAFTIKNVGSLSGSLAAGTPTATSSDFANCPYGAANFVVTASVTTASLGAGASSTGNTLNATVPTTSANACQGVTFNVHMPFNLLLTGSSDGTTKFSDQVTTTGNTFTLDKLPAPVNLAATPNSAGTSVTLNWGPTPNDFATSWQVFRHTGSCTGWTPADPGDRVATGVAAQTYADSSVTAGTTYCYAVRGVINSWLSPLSGSASASPVAPPSGLYINSSPANTLTTASDVGDTELSTDGVVWASQSQYTMSSGNSNITFNWQANIGSQTVSISVWWVSSGSCGTSSPSGHEIASGSVTKNTTYPFMLTSSGNSLPTGTATLCLKLAKASGGTVRVEGTSFLTGPFTAVTP